MILNLGNVNAKIKRAREHASALENEIREWHKPHPYQIKHEVSDDRRTHRFILQVLKEPKLERWSLIFGDAIHNLRSALDHLTYAVAISESSQDPPPDEDKLAFPICDTPETFHGTRKSKGAKRKIENLSCSVISLIEIFQPFNRKNQFTPPYLGIIRDLDDKDKHRLLALAVQGISDGELGLGGIHSSCNEVRLFYPSTGTVTNGGEVARIESDVPNPELDPGRTRFRIVIGVWHGKHDATSALGSDYSEVIVFLETLADEVECVIDSIAKAVIPNSSPLVSSRVEPDVEVKFTRTPVGVACKGCGAALLLGSPWRPTGPLHKGSLMPFPVLPEKSFQCPRCRQTHEYEQSDLRTFP